MTKNEILNNYFKENNKRLVNIARRRVDHYCLAAAEDAVQEAYVRACKYFRTYDSTESFDNWFKKILYNAINQIKKDEREKGVVNYEEVPEKASETKEVVFTKEVASILGTCTMRDQEILNMYFFYGFKTREVSELLNMSHDVVRDVIRRFRARVKP